MDLNMDDQRNSLAYMNGPVDQFNHYAEQDNVESTDRRPSILISFQNSASYYTSYMGEQAGRGPGGRRKSSVALESDVQQNHPIVVMNDYPNPGPVLVAVNNRKYSCDLGYNPFLSSQVSHDSSGPSGPTGSPGLPGPPTPNVPPYRRSSINTNSLTESPMPNMSSSRRSSINANTLELPKRRRASMTPGVAVSTRRNSPCDRLLTSNSRVQPPTTLPVPRPLTTPTNYESPILTRGPKIRPPRNCLSMPTLNEFDDVCDFEVLNPPPDPSPRPSVGSSAMLESQGEPTLLVPEPPFTNGGDNWNPHQKPDWLFLDLGQERDKHTGRSRSVYVAEIWPSLVCILTAVLVTLIIYLLISYLYSQPIPTQTRNRVLPAHPKYPHHPTYENYPPPYPQNLPPPPDP